MQRDLGLLTGREHDLLVIGGGIYGAAAAWDAAQRGLAVALVEARDFGSGTSWNSLKTIHGGLRHLQRADLLGLRESVRERRALLRIAPDLVRPLPFLVPTYGHGLRGREAFALGLRLGDLMSLDRNRGLAPERRIPPARMLSRDEVRALRPGIREDGLTGGALWTDAQITSSERLIMGFLHSAASRGAVLANRVEAIAFLRCRARITGVEVRDAETGARLEVRAHVVLNACGPGTDAMARLAGADRPDVPHARGLNLVLKRPLVTTHALGALSGDRYLFLVPWRDRSILGTAYRPLDEPREDGWASFLEEGARAFPWAGLEAGDVAVVHSGLVPGHGGEGARAGCRMVDHETEDGVPGLISIQGVKYTTARAGAEKAVDLVFERLARASPPCRTAVTSLPTANEPASSLEDRTRRAVREEMALHLTDAVLRRLDLGTAGPPAASDLEAVAAVMAAELDWSPEKVAAERWQLAETYPRSGQTP